LQGQEIFVPDVAYIYKDWEAKIHPDVEALREHLEGYFEKFISTESQRKKQRRVDNALCVGHFWTGVEREQFEILGELVAWVCLFSFPLFYGMNADRSISSSSGTMRLIVER
jgi:hypothetical protein